MHFVPNCCSAMWRDCRRGRKLAMLQASVEKKLMTNFNRGTGLLVIEVCGSNPNGDPDSEGEPRTLGADRRGLISPVSFKRKLRDLLSDHESPIWNAAQKKLQLSASA